jgi:hypothetical protein
MRVRVDRSWRVLLQHRFEVPLSREALWCEISDLERYARLDFFHRAVVLDAGEPAQGVALRLDHGGLGLGVSRVGRILRWDPGRGWAFSDLSRHDPLRGFPHVYEARILPVDREISVLELRITGRWTARWLPRPLVRLWLGWILSKIVASAGFWLLRAVRAQRRRPAPAHRRSATRMS